MKDKYKEDLEAWLVSNGAEILPPTNGFELIRFKGKEVGVIYKSGKYNSDYAKEAVRCFMSKKKWDGKPDKVGRKSNHKYRKFLLDRDGSDCFLCGKDLGEDITVDHLIAISMNGKNVPSNMVLMHEACNKECGNMPLAAKVKLAIKKRTHE